MPNKNELKDIFEEMRILDEEMSRDVIVTARKINAERRKNPVR